MMLSYKSLLSPFVLLFLVGCGGGTVEVPSHLKNDFQDSIDINFDADPKLSFYEQNSIRYKKAIDTKLVLSQGLLYSYFSNLKQELLKRDEFNNDDKIVLAVDITGDSSNKENLLKEIKHFIKLNNEKFVYKYSAQELKNMLKEQKEYREDNFSGQISNITTQETNIIFKIDFQSENKFTIKVIPVRGAIEYANDTIDLMKIKTKLSAKWVEVKVPDNMGNLDTFLIMKHSVTEELYNGGSANKSITNIDYASAKKYCKEKEDDSMLLTIYPFEYARREGLIYKPSSPGNEEMIEGYSTEFDDKYCSEKDILSLRQKKYNKSCRNAMEIDDMAEDDDSIEVSGNEIILFDWNRYNYWAASKNHTGANVTFRCMKQK